jgi:hypothetical protein
MQTVRIRVAPVSMSIEFSRSPAFPASNFSTAKLHAALHDGA